MESFEKMVQPPLKNDYLKLIDTVPIFGNLKTTFREILNKLDRNDIWEHVERYDTRATQHPNKEGYKIIADELYQFINKNNIL